jgi:hypothetical protein
MNLYEYTAVITRNHVIHGTITFTDKRSSVGTFETPLVNKCLVDYILAESPEQAKAQAIEDLKAKYPYDRGYRGHEQVCVRQQL